VVSTFLEGISILFWNFSVISVIFSVFLGSYEILGLVVAGCSVSGVVGFVWGVLK